MRGNINGKNTQNAPIYFEILDELKKWTAMPDTMAAIPIPREPNVLCCP